MKQYYYCNMKTSASTNSATVNYATTGLLLTSVRRLLAMLVVAAALISSQTKEEVVVDAFLLTTTSSACTKSTTTKNARSCSNTITTLHARKYIVIGGNIDGINPNQDEDTYNMSKKERRRRERETGYANFKSGAYKKKKQTIKEKAMGVNFDKLDDKVTKERMLFPREIRNIEKNTNNPKKLSPKAARLLKQRTSGGNIDSNIQTSMMGGGNDGQLLFPEKQAIQIRVVKRGNKFVTMVQGMTLPFKERKVLLKEMKSKLGGGGALVEGVLELQGSHSEKILEYLKSKGYSGAKIVK